MTKVFVSWYDGHTNTPANEFINLLKQNGFQITHSPMSPHSSSQDERRQKWYDKGLPDAIHEAEMFIAVITPACDGSTWMQQEYHEAYSSFLKTGRPKLYFMRLDSPDQPVKYQEYYLQNSIRLSAIPKEAAQTLIKSVWD